MIEFAKTISVVIAELNEQSIEQDTSKGVSCSLVSMMFPSARGVVEMFAHDGSTVLLATTGHIRSFIAQRFNEDGEPSNKADLAPITAKIITYPTGSALESDWIVHERARLVDPDLYAKLNEQNRRAVLVLDPRSGTWRVEDTQSLCVERSGVAIGPILTKKSATQMGETLDDLFELCRFPKELALAPKGTPCAYKQMGRCPGACDGSEPMESYQRRFDQAIGCAAGGIELWKHQLKSEIRSASAELDFELAQITKRQLEQVEKLPIEALGFARSMASMGLVCITPSVRKGWAMVWVLGEEGLVPIVAVSEHQHDFQAALERTILERLGSIAMTEPQTRLDRFALIARHWMTKPARAKRRRVTILNTQNDGWGIEISRAISNACVPIDLDLTDEENTHIVR